MGVLMSVFAAIANWLTGKQNESRRNKFAVKDGITLFDNEMSPCARRVRMTLLEKGLTFSKVEVDLLKGDHLTTEFKKISPNKKVPAAAFQNVPGIEDCFVYESNVITELLDADVFGSKKLYPRDPWQRAKVKMWQDWELGLVDDFVPFVYQNMLTFVLAMMYPTKEAFLASLPTETPPSKREHWERTYDAQIASWEKLEQHAVSCYQNLIPLEAALEGRQFLVGDDYTTADLSVLPRLAMYNSVGLAIPGSYFPNIVAYIRRLGMRPSIVRSQSFFANLNAWLLSSVPGVLVKVSNWRSSRNVQRFDGLRVIDRALAESQTSSEFDVWREDVNKLALDGVLVADCPYSPNSWQLKLLLMDKGIKFSTSSLDAMDVVGRWAGSGGVTRVQHGQRCVVGIRAALDYLALTFGAGTDSSDYLPIDPLQRARAQCWQAWDQTLGYMELGPLIETDIISKVLVRRYEKDLLSLLELRSRPQYKTKFPVILQAFVCGLPPDSPCLQELKEQYSDVISAAQTAMTQRDNLRSLLTDRLRHLEDSLQGQQYLVAGCLTLADLLVFCRLAFFPFVGVKVSHDEYPNITRWMSKLATRSAFQQVVHNITTVCQC
ncbi:hypothetical protein BaRGS_00029294 [Batillaria attramentaria]|uniref:Glutathione S-transferase n=1 Tax=Batillaria attramentaria TaxID=370345 RepID=A0ABD0JX05_9CAEN